MILQITPVTLLGILLAIFIIVPFVILTIIAIWVYKDAKKKGINTVVWVLTVWIIPFFIGFIIYLIARNKNIENPT